VYELRLLPVPDQIVTLASCVPHRYVYELKYSFGHLFWDRCGKIANEIVGSEKRRDWSFAAAGNGFFQCQCASENVNFTYGWAKLDLGQSQGPKNEELMTSSAFAMLADELSSVVVETLRLSVFTRIGFRALYLFGTADRDEANERVKKLRAVRQDPEVWSSLGETTEFTFSTVVKRPASMLKVSISPFEQDVAIPPGIAEAARVAAKEQPVRQREALLNKYRAKHFIEQYPASGVVLDLDSYIEDPPVGSGVAPGDFIEKSAKDFESLMGSLLEAT
jgi:hypothetical protein